MKKILKSIFKKKNNNLYRKYEINMILLISLVLEYDEFINNINDQILLIDNQKRISEMDKPLKILI